MKNDKNHMTNKKINMKNDKNHKTNQKKHMNNYNNHMSSDKYHIRNDKKPCKQLHNPYEKRQKPYEQ